MISSHEYLSLNHKLGSQLIGQKIQYITRLMVLEPEDELRMESGPLLMETSNSSRLYISVDEGKGNILFFDASEVTEPINDKINEFTYKYQIFNQDNDRSIFPFLLEQPISNLEIISRPYEYFDFYSMCGLRLTFAPGQSICIGAYLTDLKLPDVWVLRPDEVDVNLAYKSLTS